MQERRSAQPRPEVCRIGRQIAHRLVKGEIEPFLDIVVQMRRRRKCLRQRQARRHRLNMQVVVLIDQDADACIRTDVCRTAGLRLGKFLADEVLLDQYCALQC